MGKLVLTVGVFMVVIGALLMLFERFHLPGDIVVSRGGFTLYVPLATSILVSLALTVLINLLLRH